MFRVYVNFVEDMESTWINELFAGIYWNIMRKESEHGIQGERNGIYWNLMESFDRVLFLLSFMKPIISCRYRNIMGNGPGLQWLYQSSRHWPCGCLYLVSTILLPTIVVSYLSWAFISPDLHSPLSSKLLCFPISLLSYVLFLDLLELAHPALFALRSSLPFD